MSKQRVSARLRRLVATRALDYCEYCHSQARYSIQSFSIEHMIPKEKGGETTLDNLALSCQGCNGHKHTKITARDAVTREIVPLFHPRRQKWSEHFIWNDDCSLIIGLTPTGRATVEALRLNRECVVNLRKLLYAVNEHPPAPLRSESD